MYIKITHPCVAAGKSRKLGDVLDVPKSERDQLIGLKRAVDAVEAEIPSVKPLADEPQAAKKHRKQ